MKNLADHQTKYLIAFDKMISIIENPNNEEKHLSAIKRMLWNFYDIHDNKMGSIYYADLKNRVMDLENKLSK